MDHAIYTTPRGKHHRPSVSDEEQRAGLEKLASLGRQQGLNADDRAEVAAVIRRGIAAGVVPVMRRG